MGDILSYSICLHNYCISLKKKLRYLIIISSILNLLLVCGFTGFAHSDPILSKSSLNSSSFQDELSIGHLKFTSNGGNLETAIVENNKYETQIIYTEFDTGNPILGADIRIHGDTDKASAMFCHKINVARFNHGRGHNEVAFVFARSIINNDNYLAFS